MGHILCLLFLCLILPKLTAWLTALFDMNLKLMPRIKSAKVASAITFKQNNL